MCETSVQVFAVMQVCYRTIRAEIEGVEVAIDT